MQDGRQALQRAAEGAFPTWLCRRAAVHRKHGSSVEYRTWSPYSPGGSVASALNSAWARLLAPTCPSAAGSLQRLRPLATIAALASSSPAPIGTLVRRKDSQASRKHDCHVGSMPRHTSPMLGAPFTGRSSAEPVGSTW